MKKEKSKIIQQCNLIYELLPGCKASHATEEIDASDAAIISIIYPGSDGNSFNDRAWIKGILKLEFDGTEDYESIDYERYLNVTEVQAQQIVDFTYKHCNTVKRFLIHCETSTSRSQDALITVYSLIRDALR